MRLVRLEDAILHKIIKTIGDDGDTTETYEKITNDSWCSQAVILTPVVIPSKQIK